jgi:hypothetical protein
MTIRDEDRAEAERLKLLPKKEQRAIVKLIGSVADDADVSAENRREARRRGKALESLLKLNPGKRKS